MQSPALSRSIGLVPATAMVVGTIIGASIFVQPSVMSARVGTTAGVTLAWLIAGLLTLTGALVAAELASAFPRTGGVYVFLSEAWGPLGGFLWGWAMLWIMHAGIVAAIAVGCARYVGHLIPIGVAGTRLVAVAAIAALSGLNYLGVRLGSAAQTWLTAIKVAAVIGLVLLLFGAEPPPLHVAGAAAALPARPAARSWTGLLLAIGAGLFAFGGWHMVTYAGEETVDAARTIPKALMIGTVIVTVCYVALNAAYFHVLPLDAIAASRSVAADASQAALGSTAGTVVAVIVIVSTLGALNGVILAGPRVYYAMAHDGLLWRGLGGVHPAFRTPHAAIALQAAWSAALVLTGSYETLFGRVIYTEWLFFAAMAVGLLRLRARASYRPRWRLPAAPLIALLFAVAALAVAVNQMIARPADSAIGLAMIASGIPVYLLWVRGHRSAS